MANLFMPSRQRATELRLSMASALLASLERQLTVLGHESAALANVAAAGAVQPAAAAPAHFTAYFDLLALAQGPEAWAGAQPEAALARGRAGWASLSQAGLPGLAGVAPELRVVTLGEPYFAAAEQQALLRWWDTEPDNAMDLQAVSPADLAQGRVLVAQALQVLQGAAPELFAELSVVLQEVVLARAGAQCRLNFNGVSSFAAWGAIGINLAAHTAWPQVYKTLVHECGHLVLFALAQEQPLVLNPPEQRLGSPLREDLRPLDGIYHAAFVSAREALALEACLQWHETQGLAQGQDTALLTALLEDSVLAFWDCCAQLQQHGRLAPLGSRILHDAQAYMREAFEVQVWTNPHAACPVPAP